MRPYQSYHTDLVIRYRLDLLPLNVKTKIPNSTLANWRKRDLTRIVGADHAITEEHFEIMKEFIKRRKATNRQL